MVQNKMNSNENYDNYLSVFGLCVKNNNLLFLK